LFRLTKGGKLNEGIFKGATINTPSMLCVEDYLDALKWAECAGGLKGLIDRSQRNLKVIENWVENTRWVDFLAENSATRSNTSVCLKITDPWFVEMSADQQAETTKQMVGLLEKEGAGFDIESYRDAPAGLRIWCGATVESSDVELLMPWIEWAYSEIKPKK